MRYKHTKNNVLWLCCKVDSADELSNLISNAINDRVLRIYAMLCKKAEDYPELIVFYKFTSVSPYLIHPCQAKIFNKS